MTQRTASVEPPISSGSVQALLATLVLGVLLVTVYRAPLGNPSQRLASDVYATIDLNRASPRELSLLPGIGPILAKRIAENRDRLGPFQSISDVQRVHGIGEKTIDQISNYVVVSKRRNRPKSRLASTGSDALVE